MDKIIRNLILKETGKVIQIGIVLIVCSVAAVGQDRMATLEKSNTVYNGISISQDVTKSAVLNKIISITMQDVPLLEAVKKIALRANLEMVYNSKLLAAKKRRITVSLEQVTIAKALWAVLEETGLRFAVSANKQLVLLEQKEANNSPQWAFANTQETITGTVTDAESGETLPGVNVLVKGTTTGTSTDQDGNFELEVPSLQDTLVVSFVGYQTQEVSISGRTEIDITLHPQAISGEELVVVGYGTQARRDITGAVKQIGGEDLVEQPSIQTSAALMGKISGVQIQQASGQPGGNQGTIRIRGEGTLGNSNPLILIDGVPGNLDNVSSSDIESISVLKDASSAAIYGSRAANGVILVTTKRGEQGDISLNYRGYIGWQQPTDQPKFVDAGTFMRLENIGATNLGQEQIWPDSYIQEWEASHESDPDNYPNTDWVDIVFSEPGFQQKQHLDISGGTDKIRYMASLTYDDENANVPNFNFKRYSIRLNTNVNVSEKIGFDVDLHVQRSDQEQTAMNFSDDDLIRGAYRVPPIYAAKYTNGGWGPGWNGRNPLALINDGGTATDETSRLKGRIKATYRPAETIEFELMYAPVHQSIFSKTMTKQYEVVDPNTGEVQQLYPSQNSLSEELIKDFTNNINFTSQYQQNFGNHTIGLMGGYEYVEFQNDFFNAFRDNFPLQDFEQLNAGSAANQQNTGSAESWALQSFFGRANYDLKSKYLLEATLRYDGSSRFTEDNRWGLFPSFSAGWLISEEPFMESIDYITTLKIRGSWGKLGNQQIGTYPFASIINLGQNYIFGDNTVSGGAQLDLANSNITWEETTTKNIGLDLSLFDERMYLTLDLFERMTSDILLELPVPLIIGLNAPFQNAGEVKNTGWELEASYSDYIGSDFSYSISLNLSDVKNKVMDLKGAGPFISGNSIIREGNPINAIYGYESDGLFQSQQEIDNHSNQSGQIAPGDIKYVDQNGDGLINAADRVIIGDPFPSMNYGIDISANYKNFDISAFIQGVGKRDVLLQGDAVWALYNGGKVTTWQAGNYWSDDNPGASYPRLTQTTSHNNFQASDYWMYDASYLRLRNLQIGYTLPSQLTGQLSIRNARVFFLGQNLLTLFDDMPPGIDPNVPNATSGGYFAVNRLLSVGIDINF